MKSSGFHGSFFAAGLASSATATADGRTKPMIANEIKLSSMTAEDLRGIGHLPLNETADQQPRHGKRA